jgi:hypothetical protein
LQQAATLAQQQQQQLVDSAAAVVLLQLNGDQQAIWQAAQSNGDLPDRYRYVPGITAAQKQALAMPMRKYGVDSAVFQQQASMTLSPTQLAAVTSTPAQIGQSIGAIAKAEQDIFPRPALPQTGLPSLPNPPAPANQ